MSKNTPPPTDEFGVEVTAFVDGFVNGATPEEIDRFLEEGDASFYNGVVSPEMLTPAVESRTVQFHGSFWAAFAWPTGRKASGDTVAIKTHVWERKESFNAECSNRPDLALAA